MIESEPEISKVFKLHKDWRVMISADDLSPAFDILDRSKKNLSKRQTHSVDSVMESLCSSYQQERLRLAESEHLIPRGWTTKRFNSRQSTILSEELRWELGNRLENTRLGVDFLVAGFDAGKKGYVFTVSDDQGRAKPKRHDIPGFSAIGSGAEGALYIMMYRKVSAALPLRLALYYTVEGKYFGELASGVGTRTDVLVLRAGKPAFKIQENALEEKIFPLCARLEPSVVFHKCVYND